MNRGDFVTVALQGDLGKPRPALMSFLETAVSDLDGWDA